MDYNQEALKVHEQYKGKLRVECPAPLDTRDDLSVAYTPGVAEPCRKIAANEEEVYRYTTKGHMVAVVTDGTAVLGLGDIGPKAALPVMEGKAALFKRFGGVDAVPICLDTKEPEEIIETVRRIAPAFGGINLEDISSPRCFEIERRLEEMLDIPVFHDDQHGTGIVVTAEMIRTMAKDPIVFAMANPTPEIAYDEAKAAGVRVMGTGRSDFPNQINNLLAFPGVFKGALSVRARDINYEMKVAAAEAIAAVIPADELCEENIIPSVFDPRVTERVAAAVAKAWQAGCGEKRR